MEGIKMTIAAAFDASQRKPRSAAPRQRLLSLVTCKAQGISIQGAGYYADIHSLRHTSYRRRIKRSVPGRCGGCRDTNALHFSQDAYVSLSYPILSIVNPWRLKVEAAAGKLDLLMQRVFTRSNLII